MGVSLKVSKTHSMPKTTDSQPEDAANQDAKNSADSEAESAKSQADVAPRVAKTQGPPKQTDSQLEDTAKAVGLSGQGDRLPMLCLASFSGILSIGMLAYFGRSALSQSRQRREAALLNDPAPV